MASAQTTPQVYILGTKRNIQKCLLQLIGTEEQLSGIWNVYASRVIGKGAVSMKELKEHAMDCDDSIDLNTECSESGKRSMATASGSSPHMKRLKSFSSFNNSGSADNSLNTDIGYESDCTESEEKEEVLADINAVVLEEEDQLNMKVASFIFKFFAWPALILFAIDSKNFALDLYSNFIKELGILASMEEDQPSKLLIVGIPSPYAEEENATERMIQQRDKLHCCIFDSYFGTYFDWCEIDGLQSKVQSLLNETNGHFRTELIGRKTVDKIFGEMGQYDAGKRNREDRQTSFIEIKTLGNENTSLIDKKLIFCFKSENKDYACKPDVLINEFMNTLSKTSIQGHSVHFIGFINQIKVSERKHFLNAFAKGGLIHTLSDESGKTVHVMPLVGSNSIPAFNETGYCLATNALRLSVNLDILPHFVKGTVMNLIFDHGWILVSSGPKTQMAMESFLFVKQSYGLIVQFESQTLEAASTICLCGLLNASQKEKVCVSDYETVRNMVEGELKKWKGVNTADESFLSRYIKRKDNKDIQDMLKQDNKEWEKVDIETIEEVNVADVVEWLSPWFSSKVREIETELNRKMSDSFLADIADLFGYGAKLFFVSQEIPSERLSQIEMENMKSTKDTVYQMLLEWRKRKGLKANIAALRSAIADSTHVNVNLHHFDERVNKHYGKP